MFFFFFFFDGCSAVSCDIGVFVRIGAPVLLLQHLVSFLGFLPWASFSVSFADPVYSPYPLGFNVPQVLSPRIFHFIPFSWMSLSDFDNSQLLSYANSQVSVFSLDLSLCSRLLGNNSLLDLGGGKSGMFFV